MEDCNLRHIDGVFTLIFEIVVLDHRQIYRSSFIFRIILLELAVAEFESCFHKLGLFDIRIPEVGQAGAILMFLLDGIFLQIHIIIAELTHFRVNALNVSCHLGKEHLLISIFLNALQFLPLLIVTLHANLSLSLTCLKLQIIVRLHAQRALDRSQEHVEERTQQSDIDHLESLQQATGFLLCFFLGSRQATLPSEIPPLLHKVPGLLLLRHLIQLGVCRIFFTIFLLLLSFFILLLAVVLAILRGHISARGDREIITSRDGDILSLYLHVAIGS